MSDAGWRLDERLAWRLAVLMIVVVALAGGTVGWRAVSTARRMDDAALQTEAEALAGHLRTGPDGRPILDLPPELRAAFAASDDRSQFVVTDGANHPVLSSEPAAASLADWLPAQPGIFRTPPQAQYPDGVIGAVVTAGPWRLAVAQGREQGEALTDTLLASLFRFGLTVLLPIALATVLVGIATVRGGLRPLRQVSAAAAAIDPEQPGTRLPEGRLPGELRPLVAAMNAALARLEFALESQRRFIGDAAHALRTPLAVLTARLDSLPETEELAGLRQDADRMGRLVDQMLKMARMQAAPLDVTQPVSLRQVAVEAISLLAPAAIRRHVELALSEAGPTNGVTGNHGALVIALTNLVENAMAHSAPGRTVTVIIAPPARIAVLDRGPGVAPELRERIFERFQRGSAARPGGAGLGLAIVAEIATAHGGRVWVEERKGGGSVFSLELRPPPVAPAPAAQPRPACTSERPGVMARAVRT